jgi:hypothetical protein
MGSGGSTVANAQLELNPTVKLIDFEDFCRLQSFPRNPENKNLIVDFQKIDRNDSLIIFISHCWLRGWSGAEGWDGRYIYFINIYIFYIF